METIVTRDSAKVRPARIHPAGIRAHVTIFLMIHVAITLRTDVSDDGIFSLRERYYFIIFFFFFFPFIRELLTIFNC